MHDFNSFYHYVSSPIDRKQLHLLFTRSQIREFVFPELANRILNTSQLENIYGMNVDPGVATLSAAEWINLRFNDRILLFENSKLRSSLVCTGKFQSDAFAKSLNQIEDHLISPFFYTFITEIEFPRNKELLEIENFMAMYCDIGVPFAQIEPNVEKTLWESINDAFEFSLKDSEKITLRDLSKIESLDIKYQAKHRIEQILLRKYLLRNRNIGMCFFCRRMFQSEYLVAAHVKQRSECTLVERLDFDNNVVLACRFGCDFLFELGKFTVLESGIIRANVSTLDQIANEYIHQYLTSSLLLKNEMKKYFGWHHENKYKSKL